MRINKKILMIIMIALVTLFFIPSKTKAARLTWLSANSSSRDLSWFNESTYNTTTSYTLKDAYDVAGLLYLVNVRGYTFEGKKIYIVTHDLVTACRDYRDGGWDWYDCRIDMTSYEWVPLSSSFKGKFIIGGQNRITTGTFRIVLSDDGIPFMENDGVCDYSAGYNTENLEGNCPVAIHEKTYPYTTNTPEHGTYTVNPANGLYDKYIDIIVSPEEGYTVDKISVKDAEGNIVPVSRSSNTQYKAIQSNSSLSIEVTYRLKNSAVTYPEMPVIEHPTVTTAKCDVIKGTGTTIGSELKCGSEEFYVIKNDGQTLKLIAKYNLLVGENIYKVKVNKSADDSRTDDDVCRDYAYETGATVRIDNFYHAPGYCFLTRNNSTADGIYQHPLALSAHWDETNEVYQYPQYGDYYVSADQGGMPELNPETGQYEANTYNDFTTDIASASKYENLFYDLVVGNGPLSKYLNGYKTSLENMGFTINSVDLLTLEDLGYVIQNNGKTIPYLEWHNHTRDIAPPHYEFASLKDFLSDKEAFMYNTTYWLRAGYGPSTNQIGVDNLVFINTSGGVCSSGVIQGSYIGYNCQSFLKLTTTLGAGVRPVITIPIEEANIKHNIKTETDGKGSISVVDFASEGETITFEVLTSEGYVLDSLTIVTDSGEKVTFTEKDITENDDGTITITTNDFRMPDEDVTIIANWKEENPETNDVPATDSSNLDNPNTVDNILVFVGTFIISLVLILAIKARRKLEA